MRKCCLHIGFREQGVEEANGAAAGAGWEPGGVCVEAVTPVGADRPLPTALQCSKWVHSIPRTQRQVETVMQRD